MREVIFRQAVGDMVLLYVGHEGVISLLIVPFDMENHVDLDRNDGEDGVIQLSLTGDTHFSCYSSGQTMRNSSTANSFRAQGQTVEEESGVKTIKTLFKNEDGLLVENVIIFDERYKSVKTYNVLHNESEEQISVEMFASFCISGISPYKGEMPDMCIHRLMGNWSAEGRPECRKLETAGLEPSWANYGLRIEKFGSIGSMPIQKFFPFVCLEDCVHDTFWGVMMEAPYSWQMEVFRYNQNVSVSGGVADFEYGHFRKNVKAGESYTTRTAYLTVCHHSVEEVCDRLRGSINVASFSEQEKRLPVVYNEYCASWGGPTHEKVLVAAKSAKECGAEYFIIDAGWYCDSPEKWSNTVGDFNVNEKAFPYSIAETAKKVRELGLIPGIWFEFENVASEAEIFKDDSLFLKRDGKRIFAGNRGFLDFRKKEVLEHLRKKVIGFLRDNGFGYIKIDYNECIGIGCDGAESYGSGLAEHIEGVIKFIKEMRVAIPDLVVEVCASGGHRIEPAFLSIADMISFSDAHEGYESAVVAANVNRLCPSRKNQIWAVVDNTYSLERMRYSIAKNFFGRLCLSGDIANMSEERLALVKEFTKLYKKVTYTVHMFIVRTAFNDIPMSLREAAELDGASEFKIMTSVYVRLSLPTIMVIALFIAVDKWNDLYTSLYYIIDYKYYTLQAALYNLLNASSGTGIGGGTIQKVDEQVKYAAVILTILPILVVYPFLQKYFTKGVLLGSVKE